MKLRNTLSLLCAAGIMAMALSGCGDSASGAAAASPSASTSGQVDASELIGQVQSVDGEAVTLLLGELSAGRADLPDGSGGAGAAAPADAAQAPAGSEQPGGNAPADGAGAESPALESGSSAAQSAPPDGQPSGKEPGGQPMGGALFTAGAQTAVVTVTDDTVIQVESGAGETAGSMEDIKEGAVLRVTADDQNTAVEILVRNAMSGAPAGPRNLDAEAPSESGAALPSDNG